VPPLETPAERDLHDAARLSQFAAVELFIQRALATRPDFAVTNETAPAVAEICSRLDGLPLAIELAAARTRLLSPGALLGRLEYRMQTLRGGVRDLPPRQQTLRATIDWSYQLLPERARLLFERLSVFSGGWTLEAAAAVCDPGGEAGDELLDELSLLLDASLVRESRGAGGEVRFGMLQTIREYALELNEDAADQSLARRHAAYYLDLVGEAVGGLRSPRRREWIERLEQEHDNCRAVLAWSLSSGGDLALGDTMALGLAWYWQVAGHLDEAREWLTRLRAAGEGRETPEFAALLGMAGGFDWLVGDLAGSRRLAGEGVELARRLGESGASALAVTLMNEGLPLMMSGEAEAACRSFEEADALLRATSEDWQRALNLNWLADTLTALGRLEPARERYEESLAIFSRQGDPWGVAVPQVNLGWLAVRDGDLARAERLLSDSVERFHETGDRYSQAWAESALGFVLLEEERMGEAELALSEALRLAVELRNPTAVHISLAGLAGVSALCRPCSLPAPGSPTEAEGGAAEGRAVGEPVVGARLLGATRAYARRLPSATWYTALVEARVGLLLARVGDAAALEREGTAGESLPLEEALAVALGAPPQSDREPRRAE
jgi:predicted ATPase